MAAAADFDNEVSRDFLTPKLAQEAGVGTGSGRGAPRECLSTTGSSTATAVPTTSGALAPLPDSRPGSRRSGNRRGGLRIAGPSYGELPWGRCLSRPGPACSGVSGKAVVTVAPTAHVLRGLRKRGFGS